MFQQAFRVHGWDEDRRARAEEADVDRAMEVHGVEVVPGQRASPAVFGTSAAGWKGMGKRLNAPPIGSRKLETRCSTRQNALATSAASITAIPRPAPRPKLCTLPRAKRSGSA